MPAKGTSIKSGPRYNPLNKQLWKDFKKETGIKISWRQFEEIIWDTTEAMMHAAADEEAGIELPERLGWIVVTKYKGNAIPVDWVNSKKLGRYVPLLNLHSLGYIHHIKWFKMGVRVLNNYIYMLHPYRNFTRRVAKNVKQGNRYHTWENTDFWSTSKMDRMFEKFYKSKQNDDNS